MAANTPASEMEKLLLSCVFRLLLSATEEKERHQANPPSPKPVTGKKLRSQRRSRQPGSKSSQGSNASPTPTQEGGENQNSILPHRWRRQQQQHHQRKERSKRIPLRRSSNGRRQQKEKEPRKIGRHPPPEFLLKKNILAYPNHKQ